MRTWSPVAVAIVDEFVPSAGTAWLACELAPGESYRLRALVEGGADALDNGAVVRFDLPGGARGTGISVFEKAGAHIALRSGPGLHRTDRIFTVARPIRRVRLSASAGRGRLRVRTLVIEWVSPPSARSDVFLSFDVEASALRATGDPIDQLVWGRIGGQEYGLTRICRILEEHGLIGNFMVDFATCAANGDAELREIIEHLAGRGHEVHLHLHPDYLPEYRLEGGQEVHLDRAPYDLCRDLLQLTLDRFTRSAGKAPYVFRSGGYRVNDHLVRAAGDLGFAAMTNVKPNTLIDIALGGDEVAYRPPFIWDNGVLEIPVDVSSPEVGSFANYLTRYRDAVSRKPNRPTFNVVMHSWSLMRRNDSGRHDAHAPEYEERLRQICEHAAAQGRVRGYAEYLQSLPERVPVRGIDQIRIFGQPPRSAMGTCNVCRSAAERSHPTDGRCPSCDLGVGHRQARFALDECGEIAAGATVLGVDLTPPEREALLGQAARLFNYESAPCPRAAAFEMPAAGSVDVALWHRPRDRAARSRAMAEIARGLKPGGILVEVPSGAGEAPRPANVNEKLPRGFIRASMPAIDPITAEAVLIDVVYKPGGHLIGLSRAARRARLLGAGTLVHELGNRARRLLRSVVGYARRRP
jgi:hypothetical protein